MIPSNHRIAQSSTLLFSASSWFIVFCLLFVTLDGQAMSNSPDDESIAAPYSPARWSPPAVAETDAARALKNGDTRLLAFALRGTSIPGIRPELKQAYQERCGVRFMEGFGDVIRSDEQLANMQLAGDYAERYNAVIITECRLTE